MTGTAKSRKTRTIKVAPVARAVRVALAISVTAMALSGSSLVFAGTCTPPSGTTIFCDGSFTDTITFPDVDLTLIVGANAPSSVTPGTGAVGIEANWAGNVNVVNYADITTNAADGIHAYGSTSAQVVNHGYVLTSAGPTTPPPAGTNGDASAYLLPPSGIAIDAIAYGNVTVVNTGYVGDFGTGVYDVTAVLAESTGIGYTATIDNQVSGAIIAFTDGSGTAVGIFGQATNGSVNANNSGLLVANSYYGIADGIFANGQSVNVTNSGDLYAIGGDWAAGIEAQGSDQTSVNNSNLIYAAASAAYGHAFGVYATGGAGGTKIYNTGNIDVLGPYATGIQVHSDGGIIGVSNFYGANLTIGNSYTSYYATGIDASTSCANCYISVYNGGAITALSHYGSTGIRVVATGAGSFGNAINAGIINVDTSGKYGSMGIVVSADANATITNSGSVTVSYGGSSYGAVALAFNGTAFINNSGKVDVTAADYIGNGFGLVASSANAGAIVYNSGTVNVNAGYYGFGIQASGMTGTTVRNSGSVSVDSKYGYGIFATSGAGDVGVSNDASGIVSVTSAYGTAFGIVGVATQGNVSISNSGTVNANGFGLGIGILGRANAGNVAVSNGGNLYATSYLGTAVGLEAIADNGNAFAYGNATSNIVAYSHGNTAIGIEAIANNGRATAYNLGDITVTAGQDPNALQYTGALGVADGIFAAGQYVRVVNSGDITALGYGWAAGIEAQGGTDGTSVSNIGSITATSNGAYSHAFGIYATAGTGGVRVYNGGTINAQGSYAIGIDAQSQGGSVNISSTGDIIAGNGSNRTYYATGINAATNYAASNIYINNNGGVTALSYFGSTGIAAAATGAGSSVAVVNSGDVYVSTTGKYDSMGIVVSADADANLTNNGSVTVAYGGTSTGAMALAFNGNANVSNSGDINVTGALFIGYGYGIVASSANGSAGVFNSANGNITVTSGYYGFGIQASGLTGTTVSNYGAVTVDAKYGYGVLATSGQGNVIVRNVGSGSIDVHSAYATAVGIAAITTDGYVSVYNNGTVTASGYTDTIGVFARSNGGGATVHSTGDITATTYVGSAIGVLAHATGGGVTAYNSGDILAYSLGDNAIGIQAVSDDSTVSVSNSSRIEATGGFDPNAVQYTGSLGLADGIFASGTGAFASNSGNIYASGYGWAAGMEVQGSDTARVYNTGTISATSNGDNSHAFGIYATGGANGLTIYSGGDITAMGPYATGILAQGTGAINASNAGDITVGDANTTYYATGISAATNYANSNIFVGNSGTITANSYYGSTGMVAVATGPGSTGFASNTGDIYVNTTGKYNSMGIVVSSDGDAGIYNSSAGTVTVQYGGTSYGELALSFNGTANINNQGDVTVNGAGLIGDGFGLVASSANGSARVDNGAGSVTVYGGYSATGIQVGGLTGSVATNRGAIAVDTLKYGYGILATSGQGDVQVYQNSTGSIDVYSYAGSALGITAIATLGNVSVYNAGSVSASGYTDTIGIFGRANDGNVVVNSNGSAAITAFNYVAPAIGVLAHATGGYATVNNGGSITVTSLGEAAIGIEGISDDGTATVNNSGDITVAGGANTYAVQYTGALGLADGIFVSGETVRATNSGNISATGYGWAAGIEAQGNTQSTAYNTGSIIATSTAPYSHAFGIYATSGAGGIVVYDSGDMTVMGPYAVGIQAQSSGGINIGASGSITVGDAGTTYYATGINAATNYAASNIDINNTGAITVNSYFGSNGIAAVATGAGSNARVTNTGDIYVNTAGKYGSMGIVVSADGNATVYAGNGSSITVAYGGNSYGAVALAFNGNSYVTNLGDVTVNGAGLIGYGFGLVSSSANGSANVYNRGPMAVYGGYSATGIQGDGLTGTSITNNGDVGVDTLKYGYGILATSGQGNVRVNNASSGSLDVYSYAGSALGIAAIATLGDVAVYNSGSVAASGYGDTIGIFARARDGNVFVNSSDGSISAFNYITPAVGILAHATGGDTTVYNAGSISATSLGEAAIGIEAESDTGTVNVNNSGDITALGQANAALTAYTTGLAQSNGVLAIGQTVNVGNSGDVTATTVNGYGTARGLAAFSQGNGNIYTTGSVTASSAGSAYGAVVSAINGDANVTNRGDISATASMPYGYAFGVMSQSVYGSAAVTSDGSITVQGNGDLAEGILAAGYDGASISNFGAVTVNGYAFDYGLHAVSSNGNAGIGTGAASDITVTASNGPATGISAFSNLGNASVTNGGSVSATTTGPSTAVGILARAPNGTASVYGDGDIAVSGQDARGIQVSSLNNAISSTSGAIDVIATQTGFGVSVFSSAGDARVNNGSGGSVTVLTPNGSATGLAGVATLGNVAINNAGDVAVQGGAGGAYSVLGVYAGAAAGNAFVDSSGNITANGYAIGIGIDAQSELESVVYNSGVVAANTTRSYSTAYAILAQSNGNVSIDNSGFALAQASGSDSDVTGIVASSYGTVTVVNSGDISAVANGANSTATGLIAQANGAVNVINSGLITATDATYAVAVSLNSGAASTLRNTGTITTYTSVEGNIAVHGGNGFENILNYGTINGAIVTNGGIDQLFNGNGGLWLVNNHSSDFGDGDDTIGNASGGTIQLTDGSVQLGDGNDTFNNGGLLQSNNSTVQFGDGNDVINNGAGGTFQLTDSAIYMGAGNDAINNGGQILLTNSTIDLGDDDDAITNGGTIQLTDSSIYLGAGTGNSFVNNGVIKSFGDSLIDMGAGGDAPPPDDTFAPTAVPSLNAIPLVNNGVISFLDGAADDVLTIVGDLGGNGSIDIDVSLLNNTSDMLYVDGSVINSSVQTVNVSFDQFPTSAITLIPFAHVTGNSTDGNFVSGGFAAGNVLNLDPSNFINMQVDIVSQIDPTNASDDIFSIGLDVSGLNDTGVLASSVASGVQSLMNSQIGTWRQRVGVLPDKAAHAAGLSPWIRSFSDKGEVDPDHVAQNFPQSGNFRYDQSNSGEELGMNVNPTDSLNFGLLLSKSEGSQHLVNPGFGSDRIHADGVGLYGTWISPKGFYVDASYRWMNFDASLRSAGGEQQTSGFASAWNLEAGYDAWTFGGGFKVTPQAQYTHSRIGNIEALHGDSATFVAKGGDSSRARLGVALSKTITGGSGIIWTPYGSVNAVREFGGTTNYAINDTFFGSTNVEGTSAMVELGLGAQKGGFSVTGGVNWTDGGALQSFKGGQLTLRYTW